MFRRYLFTLILVTCHGVSEDWCTIIIEFDGKFDWEDDVQHSTLSNLAGVPIIFGYQIMLVGFGDASKTPILLLVYLHDIG